MATPRFYDNGTYNAICDECGRQFRAFQLTQRWDGLMVCQEDWETRQPQDFVRGVADKMVPPYTRPEQADTFGFFCTLVTSEGMADYGQADCAMADNNTGVYPECTIEGSTSIAGFAVAGCSIAGRPYPGT